MLTKIKKEVRFAFASQDRILFDHLPKCGGTTVSAFLKENYPVRLIYETDGSNPQKSVEEFKKLPQKNRWKYHLYHGHLAHHIIDHVNSSSIFITVLREPVDRIISHYFFVKGRKSHYLHKEIVEKNISLEDYCSSGLSHELRNFYVTHYTGLSIEEAESKPVESVDLAFKILTEKYHLVGFQDEIPAFVNALIQTASLQAPFKNTVRKKSNNRLKIDSLPKSTIDKITEVNFLDARLYERLLCFRNKGIIKNGAKLLSFAPK